MMRNLIVLGCSAVLAVALGLTSYAGSAVDTDLDGIVDPSDNCTIDQNGPGGGDCDAQQDGDNDGYGNACDTDTDNNGTTDLNDVNVTLAQSKLGGTLLTYDYDCNGQTDLNDVLKALGDSKIGKVPGPSCGHPSGTPCP
jgi:hypothetical protein